MDPSPSSPPPRSRTTSGRFLRLSCSAPLLRARLPSPRTPPLRPVRKLPLRAPSAVILRSLPCPSSFLVVLGFVPQAYEPVGMQNAELSSHNDAISPPLAVARRAK